MPTIIFFLISVWAPSHAFAAGFESPFQCESQVFAGMAIATSALEPLSESSARCSAVYSVAAGVDANSPAAYPLETLEFSKANPIVGMDRSVWISISNSNRIEVSLRNEKNAILGKTKLDGRAIGGPIEISLDIPGADYEENVTVTCKRK